MWDVWFCSLKNPRSPALEGIMGTNMSWLVPDDPAEGSSDDLLPFCATFGAAVPRPTCRGQPSSGAELPNKTLIVFYWSRCKCDLCAASPTNSPTSFIFKWGFFPSINSWEISEQRVRKQLQQWGIMGNNRSQSGSISLSISVSDLETISTSVAEVFGASARCSSHFCFPTLILSTNVSGFSICLHD